VIIHRHCAVAFARDAGWSYDVVALKNMQAAGWRTRGHSSLMSAEAAAAPDAALVSFIAKPFDLDCLRDLVTCVLEAGPPSACAAVC
jgi:hypothetical protein